MGRKLSASFTFRFRSVLYVTQWFCACALHFAVQHPSKCDQWHIRTFFGIVGIFFSLSRSYDYISTEKLDSIVKMPLPPRAGSVLWLNSPFLDDQLENMAKENQQTPSNQLG